MLAALQAGILAAPGSASYSASKFAVEGFSDALRMELIDLGISVSLLQVRLITYTCI